MFDELQITYPYIKKMKELIEAYHEFEINMRPENFTKPTSQAWYRIYLEIGARIILRTPEELSSLIQPPDNEKINPNYSYFYQEGISNIALCCFIQSKLLMCYFDGESFSLNDLYQPTYPNKTRLHKILSCFLNYLRFAHNFLPPYTKQIEDNEMELNRQKDLKMQMERADLKSKTAYISELNKKLLEAKNTKMEMNHQLEHQVGLLSSVKVKSQQLDDVTNQLHTQQDTKASNFERMTTCVKTLSCNIIDAPHEIQSKMASLNDVNSHMTGIRDECYAKVRKMRVEDGEAEQTQSECNELLFSFDSIPTTQNKNSAAELKVKQKMLQEKILSQESIIKKYESLTLGLQESKEGLTAKQTAWTTLLRQMKEFREKEAIKVRDIKAEMLSLQTELDRIEGSFNAEINKQQELVMATMEQHNKIRKMTEEVVRRTLNHMYLHDR